MKLAWLVWRDDETEAPDIHFTEPSRRDYFFKIVSIVYAVIEE